VRSDGRPVWKPATVRNALVCLKMVLGAAVEDGHAAVNPAAKVSPPKVERQENETLTAAELDRVYAVSGQPWEAIFRFLAWTGCRRGEALALRWSDVDLPAGRAFVRRSLGKFGEGAPKSAAGRRVVPLTPSIIAMLRRLQLAQPPDGAEDGGRVFRSRTGGALDPDHVGRAWRRALRKAGVRHVRMHTQRDVAVSRMVSAGASVKTVQTAVGHSSPLLTLRTYAHLLEDDVDRLAEELAKLDARLAECVPAGDPSGTTSEHFDDPESTTTEKDVIVLPVREVG
jgi:integrase